MMGRLTALIAGVVAAAGAAGATVWARRRSAAGTRPGRKGRAARGKTSTPQAATIRQPTGVEPAAREDAAQTPSEARAKPAREPGPTGEATTLQTLKGIGAVSEERLRALGVTTIAQIAAWSDEDVESIAARIRVSPERIRREDWVGQAKAATGG